MSNVLKIVVCICAFIRFFAQGESVEEMKQKFAKTIMTCAADYPLSAANLQQLKTGQLPEDQNVKCLFACTYKKIGMMDDQGKMSVDGLEKITQQYFADNPERIKKANEFTQACSSVNDLPVSDGDKGCDRAALIFKCSIEKASQFDFV